MPSLAPVHSRTHSRTPCVLVTLRRPAPPLRRARPCRSSRIQPPSWTLSSRACAVRQVRFTFIAHRPPVLRSTAWHRCLVLRLSVSQTASSVGNTFVDFLFRKLYSPALTADDVALEPRLCATELPSRSRPSHVLVVSRRRTIMQPTAVQSSLLLLWHAGLCCDIALGTTAAVAMLNMTSNISGNKVTGF